MMTTANSKVEKGYVQGPHGKVHYWTIGEGETLFLVHQSTSTGEEYAGLIPYLSSSYRLISYDWPGHGNSDDPDHELGVDEYTESAVAVLDHLKVDHCHVLGHHGGALIAMNIAHQQPKRVGKLILSGTSGPKTKEESEAFTKSLKIKKRHHLERDGQSLLDAWTRYADYMPECDPEEVLKPFLTNIISRLRPYDAHYEVLKWNREPALHSLRCPVLLLQGTEDFYVTRQEKLLEIIPNSERQVVQGAGPFQFYEKPKESAEIIDAFLMRG